MSLPRMLRPANLAEPLENPLPEPSEDFVGSEVRSLRNARGIKLQELARRTGFSIGYLSQIERGLSSPTVDVLQKIAQALGVTISWFFRPTEEAQTGDWEFVVRAARRRKLTFDSGITDELLSPTLDRELELLRCTFPPGSESGEAPYQHCGEEAGFVVAGTLELWVADKHFVLEQGDSFQFESSQPHRYSNPGNIDTVVIWAITPPTY